jgi:fluoride exporter
MQNLLYIVVGGVLGVLSRYFLSGFINSLISHDFKFGTIIVNLIGSFLIGLIWGVMESFDLPDKYKGFTTTGFLGCFTTFSTFSLETLQYLKAEEYLKAGANVAISNVLGIALVFVGYFISKNVKG